MTSPNEKWELERLNKYKNKGKIISFSKKEGNWIETSFENGSPVITYWIWPNILTTCSFLHELGLHGIQISTVAIEQLIKITNQNQ